MSFGDRTSTKRAKLSALQVLSLAVLASLACHASDEADNAEAARAAEFFTVVVLPDTQYYAAAHPEVLAAQVRWVIDHRNQEHIAMVLHEGDIVDADEPLQWERAAQSLHEFDGLVPYVLSTGNHDYRRDGHLISRDTLLNRYFAPAGFEKQSWFGSTFEPGHLENSFALIDAPGGPWLFLSLEFGPRDAVLAWADRVAKRFSHVPAVVVTHAYLAADDRRYDHAAHLDQPWNPYAYLEHAAPGAVNDGEEIWRKLVVANPNILFVLCGHELGDGVGRLTSPRGDGPEVHQILANYQTEALGGSGYLRLMRFFPRRNHVVVETFSPYLHRFRRDSSNAFDLDYHMAARPRLAEESPAAHVRDTRRTRAATLSDFRTP